MRSDCLFPTKVSAIKKGAFAETVRSWGSLQWLMKSVVIQTLTHRHWDGLNNVVQSQDDGEGLPR